MSAKIRQEVEKKIVAAALKGLLAAGYHVAVNDGAEVVAQPSRDEAEIITAMFSTDEDHFIVTNKVGSIFMNIGFVSFIYGHDVIHDYSVNLEDALKEANEIASSYS